MGRKQGPRKGSMQVWPRKRCYDFLPRVNWDPIISNSVSLESSHTNPNQTQAHLLGFVCYKVGMMSAFVKDNTADSMTKNKKIIVPATILECPPMKILSARFYKYGKVVTEVLSDNIEKELKRAIRMPKAKINTREEIDKIKHEDFEDLKVIAYSEVKKIGLKKTPDISEIAISGNKNEKIEFVKNHIGKEITIGEVFQRGVIDIRGVTKGKGFQGSVKRFGVRLRNHKAEKGQRKVGSIGAWHPIGVRFTVPRPGQLGLFSRIAYNNSIIAVKKASDSAIIKKPLDHYGFVRGDFIIVSGSVQGPAKRQLLLTSPLRPTKKQAKKNYELLELR